jgi:hypothetical protein
VGAIALARAIVAGALAAGNFGCGTKSRSRLAPIGGGARSAPRARGACGVAPCSGVRAAIVCAATCLDWVPGRGAAGAAAIAGPVAPVGSGGAITGREARCGTLGICGSAATRWFAWVYAVWVVAGPGAAGAAAIAGPVAPVGSGGATTGTVLRCGTLGICGAAATRWDACVYAVWVAAGPGAAGASTAREGDVWAVGRGLARLGTSARGPGTSGA